MSYFACISKFIIKKIKKKRKEKTRIVEYDLNFSLSRVPVGRVDVSRLSAYLYFSSFFLIRLYFSSKQ